MTWQVGLTSAIGWALLVVMPWLAPSAAAAEVTIADFVGEWRGVEVVAQGHQAEIGVSAEGLSTKITRDGDGFRIEGLVIGRRAPLDQELERRPMEATFAPTGQPGVFAFDPGGSSLFSSLFADPATGNPLEGDTLLWARLEGATLHLYSLSINQEGGFDLEHTTGTLEGDLIHTRSILHMENDRMQQVDGVIQRVGN